jgi:DNA-binding transcriptional ArsR family regulator/uncharacterized protein YndB with AHSA1/START domain
MFEVLVEPHRRRILDLLRGGEQTVGDLVAELGISQPGVSKHLRVLRRAGLVEVRADGQRRRYRLRTEPLREIDDWLAPYRAAWSDRLDALEAHLDDMDAGGGLPMDERDLGTLARQGDRWTLTFTRKLAYPQEKVWRAVTEPEHLAAWYPQRIVGERRAGAPLRFVSSSGDGFDGQMLVFDPPSVMEFTWGTDLLRIELEADGPGTLLTLIDTFDDVGKAARDAAGWHECLDLLASDLDGTSPPAWGQTWRQVHPVYVTTLGPEASTIGPPPGWQDHVQA